MCRLCLSVRTHSAGSGIRDATLVLDPAIVRTFFMGEGSVEGSSDGRHREHTHCRTTKYRAAGEERRSDEGWKSVSIYFILTLLIGYVDVSLYLL